MTPTATLHREHLSQPLRRSAGESGSGNRKCLPPWVLWRHSTGGVRVVSRIGASRLRQYGRRF